MPPEADSDKDKPVMPQKASPPQMDSVRDKPVMPQKASPQPEANAAIPKSDQPQRHFVPSWLVPLAMFTAAAALFWFISAQWTNWESSASVKTDDAYIRADIAPLSTKVAGTVEATHVNDFQKVKAGQILVELKNDDYKARVNQAEAAVQQAESKLEDMKQRKEQQDARIAEAQAALETSREIVKQADDGIVAAEAAIEEAKSGVDAARAGIRQSQSAVRAASAEVTRSSLERQRQEGLLSDESTTRQKVEQAVSESDRAAANLDAQNAAEARARAELSASRAQLSKALQSLSSSHAEKAKSLASVVSHEQELTAQRKQRLLLDGEQVQLSADLASKKAALTLANVDLGYTIIRAPRDGVVGELKVKPGQLVSAGTQVISFISSTPWIIANYRETQLMNVKPGDRVDVDIDALPRTHLRGHVESISPASGAQFSLLPPENATGNFTKITQRIPVKIAFDEDRHQLAALRPGMSVITTIKPGNSH